MKIHGVNGIRTHGAKNIDKLVRAIALKGFEVEDIPLPERFLSARWGAESDGGIIADVTRDGDILVAHSFGCLRSWYAHTKRNYKAIICIAPAMAKDQPWRYPNQIHAFYSKSDWAVRIGMLLPLHPFGSAGNKGFDQPGIINNYCPGLGHNDYFERDWLGYIADYVAAVART